MLYMVLYTLTSLPMMPRLGTQALVVSRADKIYISALFASSLVRHNICEALMIDVLFFFLSEAMIYFIYHFIISRFGCVFLNSLQLHLI